MPPYSIVTYSSLDQLNLVVAPYFEQLELQLNRNTIPRGEIQPGGFYLKPKIASIGGLEKFPLSQELRELSRQDTPRIYSEPINPEQIECKIIRRIMGYSTAIKLLESGDINLIKPLVHEMLLTLKMSNGFGSGTLNWGTSYASFKRVWSTDLTPIYFIESENSAGYELRLYSDAQSCIGDITNESET